MRWCAALPLLLLFLNLVGGATEKSPPMRICAFNVNRFNAIKAKNFRVMHTLTKVVSHCSITLLQEVKDLNAIKSLVSALNRENDRYDGYTYQSVSSDPLGNSPNDEEHYVFIHRTQQANVINQHQYRKTQSFTREPFIVRFHSDKAALRDFVLVPLRCEPRQAVQEIDRLYDVYQHVVSMWNNTNVMFLGDFHASCAYLTRADKKNIRLFKHEFSWLIKDSVDTTVTEATSCAYDRIVVTGKSFQKAIRPYSAQVFDYGKKFKLSRDQVATVSDHLPVFVELKGSSRLLRTTPILILLLLLLQSLL